MSYEDMKWEILHLKQRLRNIISENNLLKVKVRKLQSETSKKDKDILYLLDAKKSSNGVKMMSEMGASMLLKFAEKNSELERLISIKDALIRELESGKQTKVSFSEERSFSSSKTKKCSPTFKFTDDENDVCMERELKLKKCQQLFMDPRKCKNSCRNGKVSGRSNKCGNSSDTNKLLHMEVAEIKYYFLDILKDIEETKRAIVELSSNQKHLAETVKNKNKTVELLQKQIKILKRDKFQQQKSTTTLNKVNSCTDSESKDTHSICHGEEKLFKTENINDLENQQCIDYIKSSEVATDDSDVETGN